MIFKILPTAKASSKDVLIGSILISVLFSSGKFFFEFYLANSSLISAYGVASSFILVLLWVFFSSQIFLFGAVFIKIYSEKYGTKIVPRKNSVHVVIKNVLVQSKLE
jgi:membrane protein